VSKALASVLNNVVYCYVGLTSSIFNAFVLDLKKLEKEKVQASAFFFCSCNVECCAFCWLGAGFECLGLMHRVF